MVLFLTGVVIAVARAGARRAAWIARLAALSFPEKLSGHAEGRAAFTERMTRAGNAPRILYLGVVGSGNHAALRAMPPRRAVAWGDAACVYAHGLEWWFAGSVVMLDCSGVWPDDEGPLDVITELALDRPFDHIVVGLDSTDLDHQMARLRRFLERVRGAPSPLHIVMLRCDRWDGFFEAFAELDDRARRRPLGIVLDRGESAGARYGQLVDEVRRFCADRVGALVDPSLRVKVTALADRLAALPITQLLDELAPSARLRSVSFTAAQPGGWPAPERLPKSTAGEAYRDPPQTFEPRALFVRSVLDEVIFAPRAGVNVPWR